MGDRRRHLSAPRGPVVGRHRPRGRHRGGRRPSSWGTTDGRLHRAPGRPHAGAHLRDHLGHGPGRGRSGGRDPPPGGGRPRRGPRHVRHRQLPAGLRRRPGRSHAGCALERCGRVPHGRVRRRGTRAPRRVPTLDPPAHRRTGRSPGRPLPRRAGRAGCRVGPVRGAAARPSARSLLSGDRRERPPGLQRSTGGRLRRPARREGGDPRRRPAGANRWTRATSPMSTPCPPRP